jgi:hypothetical protein
MGVRAKPGCNLGKRRFLNIALNEDGPRLCRQECQGAVEEFNQLFAFMLDFKIEIPGEHVFKISKLCILSIMAHIWLPKMGSIMPTFPAPAETHIASNS